MPCNGSKNLSSAWRTPRLTSPCLNPFSFAVFFSSDSPLSFSSGFWWDSSRRVENQSDNVAFTRSGLRGEMWETCASDLSRSTVLNCVSAVGGRGPGWCFFMATLNLCFLPSSFCCPLILASAPLLPLFLRLSSVFKRFFQDGSFKKMVVGIVWGGWQYALKSNLCCPLKHNSSFWPGLWTL